MFCTNCGSKNEDDARYCETCGAELVPNVVHAEARAVVANDASEEQAAQYQSPASAQVAQHQPLMPQGAQHQASAQTAPSGKKGRKGLFIALIVLAALFVITAIVAVVMRVSGHSDQPNLDTLVRGESSEVAATFEGLDAVKLHDETYYTRPEWKDIVKSAGVALSTGKSKDMDKVAAQIREHAVWAVAMYEDEANGDINTLKSTDLQRNKNPSLVACATFRALDNPTPDDIRKIVQEVVAVDSLRFGYNITDAGKSDLSTCMYAYGIGEGPKTFIKVRVYELEGIYEIRVTVCNTEEFKTDYAHGFIREYESEASKWFDDEYTFPKK